MYKLETTSGFNKRAKKLIKNDKALEKKLDKALRLMKIDPFYPGLKTHQVNLPKWQKVFSSWVTEDIRIIWREQDSKLILVLLDIGGHSGGSKVYK